MIRAFMPCVLCSLSLITNPMKKDSTDLFQIEEYSTHLKKTRKQVTIEFVVPVAKGDEQVLLHTETIDANTQELLTSSYKILNTRTKTSEKLHHSDAIRGATSSSIKIKHTTFGTKQYELGLTSLHVRNLALTQHYPSLKEGALPLKIIHTKKDDRHVKMQNRLRYFKRRVMLSSFSSQYCALALVGYKKVGDIRQVSNNCRVFSAPVFASQYFNTFKFIKTTKLTLSGPISSCDWNHDQTLLALSTNTGTISIYDLLRNSIIHTFESNRLRPSLAWHPSSNTLAIAGIRIINKLGNNSRTQFSLYALSKILKKKRKNVLDSKA